jgi:hypothetical protein
MAEAVPSPAGRPTGRRGRIVAYALAGVAIVVQVLLVLYYLPMGLGWGGVGYFANLAQGVAAVVVAVLLIPKRPLLVLPLPVVSYLLMLTLQAVDPSLRTTDCTAAELSAAAELPPPPGSPRPSYQSYGSRGCSGDFVSSLSGEQVLDHYRAAARDAGWQVEESAGEAELEVHSIAMSKESMGVEVSFEPAGEEGPPRDQVWVVVDVYERER